MLRAYCLKVGRWTQRTGLPHKARSRRRPSAAPAVLS